MIFTLQGEYTIDPHQSSMGYKWMDTISEVYSVSLMNIIMNIACMRTIVQHKASEGSLEVLYTHLGLSEIV